MRAQPRRCSPLATTSAATNPLSFEALSCCPMEAHMLQVTISMLQIRGGWLREGARCAAGVDTPGQLSFEPPPAVHRPACRLFMIQAAYASSISLLSERRACTQPLEVPSRPTNTSLACGSSQPPRNPVRKAESGGALKLAVFRNGYMASMLTSPEGSG